MKKIAIYTVLVSLTVFFTSCKEEKKVETPESTPEVVIESNFGGLALYTVRDDMGVDAKATLKAVSDAGYKNIEAAGYSQGKFYNMSPIDFKALLDSLELVPISTHHSDVTLENADAMMADVKAAGFEYFVVPIPPMGLFHYDDATSTMSMTGGAENLTKIINTLGEKAHAAGLKLLYHNHDFEFKKDAAGIVPIEYMLEHTDP
ncbi:MAG: sugar phosphate isomerase/epimerase family protein, partial [Cellulophaga baltica]